MIEFRCPHCAQKLRTSERRAGRQSRCPRCKRPLVVPKAAAAELSLAPAAGEANEQDTADPSLQNLTLLDAPPQEKTSAGATDEAELDRLAERAAGLIDQPSTEEAEETGQRRYPWPIDILLYPASGAGLGNLAVFVGVPLCIRLAAMLLGPFGVAVALPGVLVNVAVGLYLMWYFTECVRDSACGGTRAPEAIGSMPDLGEAFAQGLRLAACYMLFFGPAFFYWLYTQGTDAVFRTLLAVGVALFPMGLLAVVMFNSSTGFNPLIWLGSIASTFLPYCGLVLLFAAIVCAFRALPDSEPAEAGRALSHYVEALVGAVFYFVGLYGTLVVGHVLGRFYWRYQEQLNWEV